MVQYYNRERTKKNSNTKKIITIITVVNNILLVCFGLYLLIFFYPAITNKRSSKSDLDNSRDISVAMFPI